VDHPPVTISIINLSQRPEAIEQLARWHFQQWQSLYPADDVGDFAAELQQSLGLAQIPSTWILADPQTVYGSVSIFERDLDSDTTLTPWLANLWVHPELRGKGWGRRLVQHTCTQARLAGIARLHLFTTEHAQYYAAMGWQTLYEGDSHGQAITVMRYTA
jgi:predicted N-acetyltransferase YhbS